MTPTEAVMRFEQEGYPESLLITRRLREADQDLWAKSGRGGGRSAAQVQVYHLRNLLLAQAALQPSAAPDAVAVLAPLRLLTKEVVVRQDEPQGARQATWGQISDMVALNQSHTLAEWLDYWITAAAQPGMRASMPAHFGRSYEIALCLEPPSAIVTWPVGDAVHIARYGMDTPPPAPRSPRRVTILTVDALLLAGEIIADTEASASSKSSGAASNGAGSENDSGGARQSAAADVPTPSCDTEAKQYAPLLKCAPRSHTSSATACVMCVEYVGLGPFHSLSGMSPHAPPAHHPASASPG